MKGLTPLFLGIFATFAFSWIGLALVPNIQIGHLDPQSDEDGTDIYPMPQSGMADRGRQVYRANGCVYCHSQQVRPEYASSDIERKWGDRRSAPRDYIFARPVVLGRERLGPDLANIGKRAPAEDQTAPAGASATSPAPAAAASPATPAPPANATAAASPAPASNATAGSPPPQAAPSGPSPATAMDTSNGNNPLLYSATWHHQHLYAPRSVNHDSTMPAFRFLYDERRIGGERSVDALNLTGDQAPPEGYEVVPTYDAKCLVAYLMSLDQSHPLKEVKSNAPASAPASGKPATK